MKYLNISLITLTVLSSCVFSGKPDVNASEEISNKDYNYTQYSLSGDSITVDTIIGDFKLFYRVKDIIDTSLVTFSCDEDESVQEQYRVDKYILLNIQKIDSTCVVAYETIGVKDFASVLEKEDMNDYVINKFYLKEVNESSVVFVSELCVFGKDVCRSVDIRVVEDGSIQYTLLD